MDDITPLDMLISIGGWLAFIAFLFFLRSMTQPTTPKQETEDDHYLGGYDSRDFI